MSNILNQLISKKITLEDALYRLLVISNEVGNSKLSEWCTSEIKGYLNKKNLPDYRKFTTSNIYFSGIWGNTKFEKTPIQPGYLTEETRKAVSKISLFEGISDVIKRKDLKNSPYKELNMLAPEIYKNTSEIPGNYDGLQCYSIIQEIPVELYQRIYSEVQVRVINILSYLEKSGIDIDNCKLEHQLTNLDNDKIYEQGVLKGQPITISIIGDKNNLSLMNNYSSDSQQEKWYKKIFNWFADCWKEILITIIASVACTYLIEFLVSKF